MRFIPKYNSTVYRYGLLCPLEQSLNGAPLISLTIRPLVFSAVTLLPAFATCPRRGGNQDCHRQAGTRELKQRA